MNPSFLIGMGGPGEGEEMVGIFWGDLKFANFRQILKNVTPRAAKVRSGLAPEGTSRVQRGGGEIPPLKKKKQTPKKPKPPK